MQLVCLWKMLFGTYKVGKIEFINKSILWGNKSQLKKRIYTKVQKGWWKNRVNGGTVEIFETKIGAI